MKCPSKVFEDYDHGAIFVCAVHFDLGVRSWAFQNRAFSRRHWIGPRHTNFDDASICAFDARDGTWAPGESLITLMDLYSVWVARYLHFQQFGRWPGRQAAIFAAERIVELQPEEYCGCSVGRSRYIDCCRDADQKGNSVGRELYYALKMPRRPPQQILNFASDDALIPNLDQLFLTKEFDVVHRVERHSIVYGNEMPWGELRQL